LEVRKPDRALDPMYNHYCWVPAGKSYDQSFELYHSCNPGPAAAELSICKRALEKEDAAATEETARVKLIECMSKRGWQHFFISINA